MPERYGGVLRVERSQSGVQLIGEGRGVQCCKVKDQVVQDKLHTNPGFRHARESRRSAGDQLRGVYMAWSLKLERGEGRVNGGK